MSRLVLTFETLFQVLSADKAIRNQITCRPVPTPPKLSTSICGVSIELLDKNQKDTALSLLADANLIPAGVHEVP
jgi:hypothetical protein